VVLLQAYLCRLPHAGQRHGAGAALYAGFSEPRNVWLAFMVSGALSGIAGVGEVAGPLGQLQPSVSPGYGFAAIIVASGACIRSAWCCRRC
jgi:simple sugar transport system permease protein